VTTERDLRQAYRDLVRHAPSREELVLTPPDVTQPRHPRRFLLITATAVATIAAVLAILLVVRPDGSPNPRPAGPGGPPTFPTDYWFGPASLPGYTLTSIGLSATGQSATYERTAVTGTATSVALTGLQPTPQELAAITALPTVQIGAAQGHYGDTRALGKAGPARTNKQSPGRWTRIAGSRSRRIRPAAPSSPRSPGRSGRLPTITSPS